MLPKDRVLAINFGRSADMNFDMLVLSGDEREERQKGRKDL